MSTINTKNFKKQRCHIYRKNIDMNHGNKIHPKKDKTKVRI